MSIELPLQGSILIRIHLPSDPCDAGKENQQKKVPLAYRTQEFDVHLTVGQVIQTLLDDFGWKDVNGKCKYGLFLPNEEIWMYSENTLSHYNLSLSNRDVELKNALANVNVRCMDGSLQKKILINLTHPLRLLMPTIASRFGLTCYLEFGLQREDDAKEKTWLDESLNLSEQGFACEVLTIRTRSLSIEQKTSPLSPIGSTEPSPFSCSRSIASPSISTQRRLIINHNLPTLILRKEFWLQDVLAHISNPNEIHFSYLEIRKSIVAGCYPTTLSEAIQLAGLDAQISFQNYDPLTHVAGFLKLDELLPPEHRSMEFIEEDIYKVHRKLKGLSDLKSKLRYIKIVMQYPTFGIKLFPARERIANMGYANLHLYVGIDRNNLYLLNGKTKEILSTHKLSIINESDFKATINQRELWWRLGDTIRDLSFHKTEDLTLLVKLFHAYRTRDATKHTLTSVPEQ